MMDKKAVIYVAGHRGMVGSAIVRRLRQEGYTRIITRTRAELDLTRQADVEAFFQKEQPAYVFLAAARVGGIMANSTYKAEFIYQNIMIAANIIDACYKTGVTKLLNLGSTCIYPKLASQPLKEESLLTGLLEPTNDAYAIAKISAIKMCLHYNQQYGTNFLSCMPTNLYGPNDNYNLATSHVLPALIRKFHLAKLLFVGDMEGIRQDFITTGSPVEMDAATADDDALRAALVAVGVTAETVTLWGSGSPYREFLYVDDLADACLFLMNGFDAADLGEFVNVGTGQDNTIKDIATIVKDVIGYTGTIGWDTTKPDGTPKKQSDPTRLTALGWSATTSLKDGLATAYKDYQVSLGS